MALYHIRTLKNPHQTSLVSNADFPNHLVAIAGARQLLRKGEGLEVWCAEKLVYRIGSSAASFEKPRATQPTDRHHISLQSHLAQTVGTYFERKWSILAPKL
jgi:hypothetical protein